MQYDLNLLIQVAKSIKTNGDGEMFWHEDSQQTWWTLSDSDGDNDFEGYELSPEEIEKATTTELVEIERRFLEVPFVKAVQMEPESYPIHHSDPGGTDGWTRIEYTRI